MNRPPLKPLRRARTCAFCSEPNLIIDYKAVAVLTRFISERGKIMPRRRSGTCAIHQRQLEHAIKLARFMALLPFVRR